MNKQLLILSAAHIFLPLLVGALIYIVFRHDTTCCIPMLQFTITPPIPLANWVQQQPWILHHLSDALWLYAFTAFNLLLWKEKSKFCILYSLLALFIAITTEFFQKGNIMAGTFDIYDIYAYFSAFVIAFILLGRNHLTYIANNLQQGIANIQNTNNK